MEEVEESAKPKIKLFSVTRWAKKRGTYITNYSTVR